MDERIWSNAADERFNLQRVPNVILIAKRDEATRAESCCPFKISYISDIVGVIVNPEELGVCPFILGKQPSRAIAGIIIAGNYLQWSI